MPLREPLRPDVPGPVSRIYGMLDRAREGPLYCRCGLAFDTAAQRQAHWDRPFRTGGKRIGRAKPHGEPTARYTRTATHGQGAPVRDGERITALTVVPAMLPPMYVSTSWRVLREPRVRKVRLRIPKTPASDAWRARGQATVVERHDYPPPPKPEPRTWTVATRRGRASGQAPRVTSSATPGLTYVEVIPCDVEPRMRAPASVLVTTPHWDTVAQYLTDWTGEDRWIWVRSRPDVRGGTVYVVHAGKCLIWDRARKRHVIPGMYPS